MTQTKTVEGRLRLFLLGLAAFLCVGTIVELIFQEHDQEPLQFVPLLFCAVGFVLIVLVILRPSRATITAMRAVMAFGVLASLVGMYEHLEQNMGFVLDIKPNTPMTDAFLQALYGAAPMLAPGILAVVGAIAIMGTYAHPALQKRTR